MERRKFRRRILRRRLQRRRRIIRWRWLERGMVGMVRATGALLSRRDSAVCLSVEDEGPGISVEEIPLVFQRFYRGSNARNDGNTGFGLGLALAAGIAEQHRSTIEVSSTYGQGSSFTVVFPPAVSTSEFAGLPLNRTRMADIRG